MSSRSRGFSHERDLVRRLWERGLAVIRAPASGSKAKRVPYPDVVAIYKGRVMVFEVKTTRKRKEIYIKRGQVEKLREFAERAGGKAFVAVKAVGTGEWLFAPVEALEQTPSGNYKVSLEGGGLLKMEQILAEAMGVKSLSEYLGRATRA